MNTEKICKYCSKVFIKKKNISQKIWETRRFCSHECYYNDVKIEREKRLSLQKKICIVCGKEYIRKENQSNVQWNNSKHCSKKCNVITLGRIGSEYNKKRAISMPKYKNCIICGNKFGKNGRRGPVAWLKAKTCSHGCAVKYTKQLPYTDDRRLKLIANGKSYSNRRLIVLARDDFTCQLCGFRDPLIMQVDHKIPKLEDKSLELDLNNLQTLCPNCHAKKTVKESKTFKQIYPRVELLKANKKFLNKLIQSN